ncbi:MAG: hypothetical protein PHH83_00135 [Patescibacteria group bacterium]|nr:hypothetical protein [Patescibacteria group bacterium]
MQIQKLKNILLLMCSVLILVTPIFNLQVAFYICVFFIIAGGTYIMTKKNLILKKDRTILLVLLALLVGILISFYTRFIFQ